MTGFRQRFVLDGPIDRSLATERQRLQAEREQADYDAAEMASADTRAALVAVEPFVGAVKTMLEDPGAR